MTRTPRRMAARLALAAAVRAEMGRRGVNQSQLAARLHEHQSWVSRRVNVHAETPMTVDDVERIAAALDVPLSRFFSFDVPLPDGEPEAAEWVARDSNPEPADYVTLRLAA